MSAPRFTVIVACYQTEPYLVRYAKIFIRRHLAQ